MPALLIRNVPPAVHRRLKQVAKQNRRSVSGEVMVIIERSLPPPRRIRWPKPVEGRFPLTDEMIRQAVREGRA